MSIEERLEVLKQVEQVAALAGVRGQIDDDGRHFQMGFNLSGGRSQLVFIRPTGKTPPGQTIVTFFSPCLTVKKGLFSGFSKERALDLLRRNENLMFARFGIWETDDESMVVASVDHILDTLDPEEFEASAWYVATAADGYEETEGKDDF